MVIIDAVHVFGNFCRLLCCFTDCILQSCLTCNNGNYKHGKQLSLNLLCFCFFVLFAHKINLCVDWMISHNRTTGRLGFDILIDTGTFHFKRQ